MQEERGYKKKWKTERVDGETKQNIKIEHDATKAKACSVERTKG